MMANDLFVQQGKRCSCCGRIREWFYFNHSRSTNDGLQSYCKDCQREYRQKHPNKEFKYKKKDNHSLFII